jgi:hypothetical protein
MLSPQMQGVVTGTGIIKSVFNARMDGLLTPTKYALLLTISVSLGIQLVYALLVSRVMT